MLEEMLIFYHPLVADYSLLQRGEKGERGPKVRYKVITPRVSNSAILFWSFAGHMSSFDKFTNQLQNMQLLTVD